MPTSGRTSNTLTVDALSEKVSTMPRWWPPRFATPYGILLGTMLAARLAVSALGGNPMIASQAGALSWPMFTVLAVLGFGALFLAERAGFSSRWAAASPSWRWHAMVVFTGLGYGVLSAS